MLKSNSASTQSSRSHSIWFDRNPDLKNGALKAIAIDGILLYDHRATISKLIVQSACRKYQSSNRTSRYSAYKSQIDTINLQMGALVFNSGNLEPLSKQIINEITKYLKLMNSKLLTISTAVLAALLAAPASQSQAEGSTSLQELCAKFPNNSKCEGIESPIPLESREGEEYSCYFEFDPGALEQGDRCKVKFTPAGITVYQEQGEELELIDDRRATVEVEIPRDRLFSTNYQIWNKIDRWQLGFITAASEQEPAQTNFLTVIVNEDKVEAFAPQAQSLETNKPEKIETGLIQPSATEEKIEQLLETGECKYCDLGGADLSGAELEEVDLEGAYLLGANLQGANLTKANIKGANLTFANLAGAIAIETDFEAVNLQGANLEQANLEQAKLTAPALLKQANLSSATLIDADLKGANFNQANLQQADLSGANLDQTDVEIDDIPGNYSAGERFLDFNSPLIALAVGTSKGIDFPTDFLGANLEGANFSNTSLKKAIFEGANLTNVDFSESNLDLEDLELQEGVKLCGVILPDGSTSDRDCDN